MKERKQVQDELKAGLTKKVLCCAPKLPLPPPQRHSGTKRTRPRRKRRSLLRSRRSRLRKTQAWLTGYATPQAQTQPDTNTSTKHRPTEAPCCLFCVRPRAGHLRGKPLRSIHAGHTSMSGGRPLFHTHEPGRGGRAGQTLRPPFGPGRREGPGLPLSSSH